ncbi:MAG: VRR-NUC domain-containing protein [Deltaproteobacteria bacterium]|nr:VRR-NUC domain-containing protein [Deltaproteobacteria bacterium]
MYSENNLIESTIKLSPHYYFHHFMTIVEFVITRYGDLFSESENQILENFFNLPLNSQLIYVRLFNRRKNFFFEHDIRYKEIPDIPQGKRELLNQNFIETQTDCTILPEECYSLISLGKALNMGILKFSVSRKKLDEILKDNPFHLLFAGKIIRLNHTSFFETVMLLFFGNSFLSMTDMVLTDLGIRKQENYLISPQRLFNTRIELDQYLADYKSYKKIKKDTRCISNSHLIELFNIFLKTDFSDLTTVKDITVKYRGTYIKLKTLLFLIKELVQLKLWSSEFSFQVLKLNISFRFFFRLIKAQLSFFQTSKNRVLLWRYYSKINNSNHSLDFEEEIILEKLSSKLGFRKKEQIIDTQMIPLKRVSVEKGRVFYTQCDHTEKILTVENAVTEYLSDHGMNSLHTENILIPLLSDTLFHDEIFHDAGASFQSTYQEKPLDYFSSSFFDARKDLFTDRRAQLVSDETVWKNAVSKHFDENEKISRKHLVEIIDAVGIDAVCTLCIKFLTSPVFHNKGMPDLIVWNSYSYFFMEVKSPGDRLNIHQRKWLEFMSENNLNVKIGLIDEK